LNGGEENFYKKNSERILHVLEIVFNRKSALKELGRKNYFLLRQINFTIG